MADGPRTRVAPEDEVYHDDQAPQEPDVVPSSTRCSQINAQDWTGTTVEGTQPDAGTDSEASHQCTDICHLSALSIVHES